MKETVIIVSTIDRFGGKIIIACCVAWSCEYINYKEAVEAYKEKHNAEEVQE